MRSIGKNEMIMVVTPDEKEETLYVFDSPKQADEELGLPKGTTSGSLYRHDNGKRRGFKFIRVILTEEDMEEINEDSLSLAI